MQRFSGALALSVALHAAALLAASMAGLSPSANVTVVPEPLFLILGAAGPRPGPDSGGRGVGRPGLVVDGPQAQAERDPQESRPQPKAAVPQPPPKHERAPERGRRELAARAAPATTTTGTTAINEGGAMNTGANVSDGELSRSGGVGPGQGSGNGALGAGSAATAYEQTLALWLNSHKYYPASLRRRGIEGEGKLQIRISRSGRVLAVAVVSAFPHPSLEAISQDWVKRAEPFPRVPDTIPGDSYAFIVPIGFRLQ